jgi:hypothetical protein
MIITAKQFYKAWFEAVTEMKGSLAPSWRNAPVFTKLIKSSGDCVIRRVADKVSLKCYPTDYYSLDAVLYEDSDLVPSAPAGSTWLRSMSVAFEHENFIKSGVYKEVSHLLLTSADLRVLVAYPEDGITDDVWIEMHKLIRGSRYEQRISEEESFLLIFGGEVGYDWEAYVYKTADWARL